MYVKLRNKSSKPECVLSFNMDWRILVFYPEQELNIEGYGKIVSGITPKAIYYK
jgi:hypothetical protein